MGLMRREFTEFGDQTWVNRFFGDLYFKCLNVTLKANGYYKGLPRLLKKMGCMEESVVLDLASGGAGHVQYLMDHWRKKEEPSPKVIVADLNPRTDLYSEMKELYPSFDYIAQSVDMTSIDPKIQADVATICAAFHHLSAEQAHQALNEMVQRFDTVVIAEPFQRDWKNLLFLLAVTPVSFLIGLAIPLLYREWKVLLFCTLLPIVPLLVYVDGFFSVLRTFSEKEIAGFLAQQKDLTIITEGPFIILRRSEANVEPLKEAS